MSENNDDNLEFPKDGYIDPKTGMYTLPDPAKNESEFIETATGLYVPRPNHKPMRRVVSNDPNLYAIETNENMEEVKAKIAHARSEEAHDWYTFTDPTFGSNIELHRDFLVSVCAIFEDWKDIEEAKRNIDRIETAKRLTALQDAAPNRAARRKIIN